MEKSIYEIIKSSVGGDGLLPRGFSLPEKDCEAKIRFAPGAMDGIMMFHGGVTGNAGGDEYERLCGIIELASEGKKEEAAAEADRFAVNGHVLSNIDSLQDYIIKQKDRLDAGNLHDFAAGLTAGASKAEAVKIGMTVMELFNTDGSEEFKKFVRTLALCDEFTLYAAYIMRGWSNSNEEFFEAVQKVKGWGRVFLVNSFLEADSGEKELWLLQNGVCNEVLPNYSAIDCYRKTRLYERLQEPMTPKEYRGAALIVDALLDDGPEPGISSFDDGAGVLDLFLEQSAKASDYADAEDYGVIYRIKEYARKNYGAESCICKRADAILSGKKSAAQEY